MHITLPCMRAGNAMYSLLPQLEAAAKMRVLVALASKIASPKSLYSSLKPDDIVMMSTFQFFIACLIACKDGEFFI